MVFEHAESTADFDLSIDELRRVAAYVAAAAEPLSAFVEDPGDPGPEKPSPPPTPSASPRSTPAPMPRTRRSGGPCGVPRPR
jgi:hypothetical protein